MVDVCCERPPQTTREYNRVSLPERTLAVPSALDGLTSNISDLESVAGQLVKRLAPVTRLEPTESCCEPRAAGDPCVPEVVVRIGDLTDRVDGLRRMLEDAARRLEV
jgi:hypothetical protein